MRHTRNKQMEKATKGKWTKMRNVVIKELNTIESCLDKSFEWKTEFNIKSSFNKPNYRQIKIYGFTDFNPFYIYTFAEVSFVRKTRNKPKVSIVNKGNGRKKITELFDGSKYVWESGKYE